MRWRTEVRAYSVQQQRRLAPRRVRFSRLWRDLPHYGAGLTIEKTALASTMALPTMGDGFAAEHESFIQAIRRGAEPPHGLARLLPRCIWRN